MKCMYPLLLLSLVSGILPLPGCSKTRIEQTVSSQADRAATPNIVGSQFLLSDEPPEAVNVIQALDQAQDQEEILVVGRIGGSAMPWVEGRAAFSIVDLSLKSCAECGSDDCPKPWDYC